MSISNLDLLMIAKRWDRLSPEFRELYQSSLSIPDAFSMYVSPGGNFEVYYLAEDTVAYTYEPDSVCLADDLVPDSLCPLTDTIADTSRDAVDTIDTYGYDSTDWREKTSGPNGIPDYIDEIAWAMD
ncbi:MAG: hypothetical protein GF418_07215, partial [Chitinivibrionales bacterium]|nr:hypothetical protein [Chitinivibrionales bacterium]MBD3395401.1 hypothetical protein [Chitinivibrionales bacterium]